MTERVGPEVLGCCKSHLAQIVHKILPAPRPLSQELFPLQSYARSDAKEAIRSATSIGSGSVVGGRGYVVIRSRHCFGKPRVSCFKTPPSYRASIATLSLSLPFLRSRFPSTHHGRLWSRFRRSRSRTQPGRGQGSQELPRFRG